MGFKEIDHQADLAFEIWGKDENELLEEIMLLFRKLFGIKELENKISRYEIFHYKTFEDLIFTVGNELIYLFSKYNLFPSEFDLDTNKKELKIALSKILNKDMEALTELKALTYHKLKLNKSDTVRTYLVFDV